MPGGMNSTVATSYVQEILSLSSSLQLEAQVGVPYLPVSQSCCAALQ